MNPCALLSSVTAVVASWHLPSAISCSDLSSSVRICASDFGVNGLAGLLLTKNKIILSVIIIELYGRQDLIRAFKQMDIIS